MRIARIVIVASILTLFKLSAAHATLVFSGAPLSQNFDSLPNNGNPANSSPNTTAWANDSTLPGWFLFAQPSPGTAPPTIIAGDGGGPTGGASGNTGSFYSFGTGTNTDRAFGGLASGGAYFGSPVSGNVAGWLGVGITNNSGLSVSEFTVGYDGEEWRNGGNTSAQTMAMEYGFGASFGAVSTWTPGGAGFNFTSPTVGSTASALDGNAGANRVAGLGGTISSLSWANGSTLWLRWIENNDVGNDHGLALDNFSFSAQVVPEPSMFVLASLGLIGLAAFPKRLARTRAN